MVVTSLGSFLTSFIPDLKLKMPATQNKTKQNSIICSPKPKKKKKGSQGRKLRVADPVRPSITELMTPS